MAREQHTPLVATLVARLCAACWDSAVSSIHAAPLAAIAPPRCQSLADSLPTHNKQRLQTNEQGDSHT